MSDTQLDMSSEKPATVNKMTKTMQALVKKEAKPGLWIDTVPVPSIGDDDVLIKTKKTSICGTDIHIYQWDEWAQNTIPVPMVIGHEFVGEIKEIGQNVTGFKVGDRVCGEGHIICGKCTNCLRDKKHLCMNRKGLGVQRHGCFAEYFNLPAENLFKIPETISDDVAAIFDPFGNAVHSAIGHSLTEETILITGAGPIGMMSVALAKHAGATRIVVTDLNDYRLDLAKQLGATDIVNVSETSLETYMRENQLTDGFTVGLEMSGSPHGFGDMISAMRHGGHVSLLGILPKDCLIDWDKVIFKLLTLKGIYGRGGRETWTKMIKLIESGLDLTPLITHKYDYPDFEQGFQTMLTGNSGKVILNWE